MPVLCLMDSGPVFWNTFVEEACKLGVKVQHNSAYTRSVFWFNNRIQPGLTGSPIACFLGMDVRTPGIPNSLDRNINWEMLMENRKEIHQSRVAKKGKTSKETYSLGKRVLVQDVVKKQWKKQPLLLE